MVVVGLLGCRTTGFRNSPADVSDKWVVGLLGVLRSSPTDVSDYWVFGAIVRQMCRKMGCRTIGFLRSSPTDVSDYWVFSRKCPTDLSD